VQLHRLIPTARAIAATALLGAGYLGARLATRNSSLGAD
jgi:hypothetical protein